MFTMKNTTITFLLIFFSAFADANILCSDRWWEEDITETLVRGLDVNEDCDDDDQDNRPLHLALGADHILSRNDYLSIGIVIDAGANLHASNKQGDTPWTLAQDRYQSFFVDTWDQAITNVHCEGRGGEALEHTLLTGGERAIYAHILSIVEEITLEEAHDRVDSYIYNRIHTESECPLIL